MRILYVMACMLLAMPVAAEEKVLLEAMEFEEAVVLCPDDGSRCTYFVYQPALNGADCLDMYDEEAYLELARVLFPEEDDNRVPRYDTQACDAPGFPERAGALCVRTKEGAERNYCFVGLLGDERWYFGPEMMWD